MTTESSILLHIYTVYILQSIHSIQYSSIGRTLMGLVVAFVRASRRGLTIRRGP